MEGSFIKCPCGNASYECVAVLRPDAKTRAAISFLLLFLSSDTVVAEKAHTPPLKMGFKEKLRGKSDREMCGLVITVSNFFFNLKIFCS